MCVPTSIYQAMADNFYNTRKDAGVHSLTSLLPFDFFSDLMAELLSTMYPFPVPTEIYTNLTQQV